LAQPGTSGRIPLAVDGVEDRSREPLFGAMLREGLTRRGLDGAEVVVKREGEAGLVLHVVITDLGESPRAFNVANLPREYLLTAKADAVVFRGSETVWKGKDIGARREFPAGEDIDGTRRNKDRALRILADDLAGEILRAALPGARKAAP
jgi:hypothetical protein